MGHTVGLAPFQQLVSIQMTWAIVSEMIHVLYLKEGMKNVPRLTLGRIYTTVATSAQIHLFGAFFPPLLVSPLASSRFMSN